MNNNVLLISFYNPKSLGLRYLENALIENGYSVRVVYFKSFNSVNPKRATGEEIKLMTQIIKEFKPALIGLSVMTSLYLETVEEVNRVIKTNFDIPIIWGGVYPTMFTEKCLEFADFIIRGEGEQALLSLVGTIKNKQNDFSDIKNLAYKSNGKIVLNELNELCTDLDKYGVPTIGNNNKYLIENNTVTQGDPMLSALSYELGASRGCPFACAYCCSINLNRINTGKGKYVRFREVDKVIEELVNAKAKIKNLKVIHFWDEVFCDDEKWINTFVEKYKKKIGLPFEIWGHPLKTDEALISKLRKAGLYKVVMGIQSGSPYIRKEIFNRPEKQEDIIRSSKVLSKCKVPQVIYDFMLRHPFETPETIKETYDLVEKLEPPFELQLHGLNFLPGTDIVKKAIDMSLVSPEDMEKLMYAPIEEQYNMYWKNENNNDEINFWYKLIYLTQFRVFKKQRKNLAKAGLTPQSMEKLNKYVKRGNTYAKFRYLYKKGIIVLKGTLAKGKK